MTQFAKLMLTVIASLIGIFLGIYWNRFNPGKKFSVVFRVILVLLRYVLPVTDIIYVNSVLDVNKYYVLLISFLFAVIILNICLEVIFKVIHRIVNIEGVSSRTNAFIGEEKNLLVSVLKRKGILEDDDVVRLFSSSEKMKHLND